MQCPASLGTPAPCAECSSYPLAETERLLARAGQGIQRLGDSWHPLQAGDAVWMSPYVPQWFAALGRSRSRYILYKDVVQDPLYSV